MPDDYTEGLMQALGDPGVEEMNDIVRFAESMIQAREAYEKETREDLIKRMEKQFSKWRHYQAGWDTSGPRWEVEHALEECLDLLAECHEVING